MSGNMRGNRFDIALGIFLILLCDGVALLPTLFGKVHPIGLVLLIPLTFVATWFIGSDVLSMIRQRRSRKHLAKKVH